METESIPMIGKKLAIFSNKSERFLKIADIVLHEKDLKTQYDFLGAIQKSAQTLKDGTYTLHHNDSLFARFDVDHSEIVKLHRMSEQTGVIMPCWKYFALK